MFKWVLSLFIRKEVVQDPWEQAREDGDYIVGGFRKEFEDVALRLSQAMGSIRVHLNGLEVEFSDSQGKIVARAVVHGECGVPCEVNVVFDATFPESLKMEFDSIFPGHVHFTSLEYLHEW